MNQPTLLGKLLSPAGFGLVLLLFFLPFVAVSCGPDDHRVTATYTGLGMVTGGAPTFSGPDIDAANQADLADIFADQYDNESLAVLAAAVILGAMALGFIRDRRTRHAGGVGFAGLGAALLLAAEIRAIGRLNQVRIQDSSGELTDLGPVSATPRLGFYLAMGVLVVLLVGHAVALFRPPAAAGPPRPDGPEHNDEDPLLWDEHPTVDDETRDATTARDDLATPGDEAYGEWLDEAWPDTSKGPSAGEHR